MDEQQNRDNGDELADAEAGDHGRSADAKAAGERVEWRLAPERFFASFRYVARTFH